MGDTSVILAGARTPIGRLLGGLGALSAAELGGIAINAARAQLAPDGVDGVVLGQVLPGRKAGQAPFRQAAHAGVCPSRCRPSASTRCACRASR